jgi:hypothetical protein
MQARLKLNARATLQPGVLCAVSKIADKLNQSMLSVAFNIGTRLFFSVNIY